jgi:prepilin-type N-terminal cleavage/methylation domain-containing protein
MMRLTLRARNGFTLVELMVVIVIIAILASIAIPKFKYFRETAKETQTAANLKVIQESLAKYGVDNNGRYPFRVRFYDRAQTNVPGFDPLRFTAFQPRISSDPARPWFSMGLFGGCEVVDSTWNDNTQTSATERQRGENKHTVVQPYGWSYNTWYRYFNQYTDPLIAENYLGAYPENPFLRRPMGSIMYGYGTRNAQGQNIGMDHTLPYEEVITTPGDFVYTFFYGSDNNVATTPSGVVPGQRSYQSPANSTVPGAYYTDTIDAYQLWAFGILPINGGLYQAYKNNGAGAKAITKKHKDWDNSGTRDMFEQGVIQYFKVTNAASQAVDKTGKKIEY